MSVRELLVKFGGKTDPSLGKSAGDASGQIDRVGNAAERNSKKSQGAFSAIGGGAKAMIGPIAAAASTVGGINFLKGAVDQASDLAEVGTKMTQIFGEDGAAAVAKFAGAGAKQLGQTSLEAQNAAANFGVFGKSAGLTGTKLAGFSNQFVQLSTDLASFHNADPSEVVDALGAALRGEAEPMRKFGVLLDDASMREEALRLGLIKTTKTALNPQQKVLAAQSLIMKQTKDAQGDFAKTSGGLANQQRILNAQWQESKAKLGSALLPVVTKATTALNKGLGPAIGFVTKAGEGLTGIWSILTKGDFKGAAKTFGLEEDSAAVDWLFKAKDAIDGVGSALKILFTGNYDGALAKLGFEEDSPLVDMLFTVREGILALPGAMRRFGDQAKPVLDLVVGGARALWSGFQENILPAILEVSRRFQGFGAVVQPIIAQVFGRAMELAREWGPTIMGYVTQVTQIVGSAFEFIGVIVGAVTRVVKGLWDRWGAGLISVGSAVFGALMKIIGGALNIIQGIIKTVMSVIRGDWSGAWEGIKKIGSGAMSVLRGIFDGGMAVITGVFRAGRDLVLDIWNKLRDGVSEKTGQARDWVVEKFTKMKTGIVDLFTGIGDTIGKKFDGIKEGIAKPLRSAATWLNDNILTPMNNVTSKFGVSIPQLPKFHQGGEIPGRGELPIMALGGEGMLNRDGMRRIGGKRTLDKLNKGHIGGILDWIKKPAKWIEDTARNGLAWGIEKLFGAVPDLSSSFPPPMAGQLLAGTVNSMKSAALGWARGKDAAEKAATATTATLPGGRAWPANTRALSGNYPGHSGVDIAAGPGSPIYAAASGPIAYAGWGRGYGQAIFQTIGNGLQAVYGHSSRVRVQQGQNVAAGQLIGDVGSTGRSSGPHLHFEVNSAGPFGSASNRNATLKWLGFDSGGWLPPGMTPTFNGTGKPEAILTAEQWERLFEALEGLANGDRRRAVVDGQSLKEAMREEVRRTVTIHTGGGTLR